jgi:microsomal dipeptidase-like Zn-dependent dipeptidase
MNVIDLHCDLLSFLAHEPGRSPDDPASRASYPQFIQGHVQLQTLAIFCTTGNDSVEVGRKQVEHFRELTTQYPTKFAPYPSKLKPSIVNVIAAFENASAFASETETLGAALERLEEYIQQIGPLFYISFTHDEENRFGGGNRTTVGLKEDGKQLVTWMHGKKIALDLSHTSDKLAYDLINFVDQQRFDIPIIASHSNFRAISNYPRNLPDDLAKEVVRRKGLIGLNFFAPFIHDTDPSALLRHVEYALELGAENALCFGADFFCDADHPQFLKIKYQRTEAFYPEFSNASVYPPVLNLFRSKLKLKDSVLSKISHQNILNFLYNL